MKNELEVKHDRRKEDKRFLEFETALANELLFVMNKVSQSKNDDEAVRMGLMGYKNGLERAVFLFRKMVKS